MSIESASTPITEVKIFTVRGLSVLLDSDLAALYGVKTQVLNQAVSRNSARFPEDFAFVLTAAEWASLRSQNVILKTGRGQHRKYLPHVFTEHGVTMLAALLNSDRAVQTSVLIVREFVRLRRKIATYAELTRRIGMLETSMQEEFGQVWQVLNGMLALPEATSRRIGFRESGEKV